MLRLDPEYHSIKFDNPVFRIPGFNLTFRNGREWAEKVSVGDRLLIEGDVPFALPEAAPVVEAVFYCYLDDFPASFLRYEHDPSCRTKGGLIRELDRIYGPAPFPGRKVTALGFRF